MCGARHHSKDTAFAARGMGVEGAEGVGWGEGGGMDSLPTWRSTAGCESASSLKGKEEVGGGGGGGKRGGSLACIVVCLAGLVACLFAFCLFVVVCFVWIDLN